MMVTIDGESWVVPSNAVRTTRTRFDPSVRQQYMVPPPFGDGTTLFDTRAQAWASIKEKSDDLHDSIQSSQAEEVEQGLDQPASY